MDNYILCLVLLIALLFMVIYTFNLKDWLIYNLKLYKNQTIIFGIILFSVFSFFTVMAKQEDNVVTGGSVRKLYSVNANTGIKDISLNKVVIVGDSRMELIYNKKDELNIPNNFIFDARSGATIDWLLESGKPKLDDILVNRDTNYTYHVIFNLGVNDLSSFTNPKSIADDYFAIYRDIINNYPDVEFYFLSVNPIDEDIIDEYFSSNKRTNVKIESFNSEIYQDMVSMNSNNINYCDSYNRLDFNLPDGLHYDSETDQKIIDYIARDCVEFK